MSSSPLSLELPDRTPRYHRVSMALHWLLAAGLIYQIGLGLWMVELPKAPPGLRAGWFNWHKSVGLVLALLIVLRGIWRLRHAAPALPRHLPRWQGLAARTNHAVLYACMLGMPLTGFLGSSFTAYPIKFFGLALPRLWGPSPALKDSMSLLHSTLGYVLVVAIAAHVLAALWHGFRRDGVVSRMLP